MALQKLIVAGDETRLSDFFYKPIPERFNVVIINSPTELSGHSDATGVFILTDHPLDFFPLPPALQNIPVFVNAINQNFTPDHSGACLVRINAWPGFLRYPLLEISSPVTDITEAEKLLDQLQWPFRKVADQPGMLTPRVIAMIINEACLTVQENVSTKEQIDIAMRLGTNYPLGPFEWAKKIGAGNIFSLLTTLSTTDHRYIPATEMLKILQSPS